MASDLHTKEIAALTFDGRLYKFNLTNVGNAKFELVTRFNRSFNNPSLEYLN